MCEVVQSIGVSEAARQREEVLVRLESELGYFSGDCYDPREYWGQEYVDKIEERIVEELGYSGYSLPSVYRDYVVGDLYKNPSYYKLEYEGEVEEKRSCYISYDREHEVGKVYEAERYKRYASYQGEGYLLRGVYLGRGVQAPLWLYNNSIELLDYKRVERIMGYITDGQVPKGLQEEISGYLLEGLSGEEQRKEEYSRWYKEIGGISGLNSYEEGYYDTILSYSELGYEAVEDKGIKEWLENWYRGASIADRVELYRWVSGQGRTRVLGIEVEAYIKEMSAAVIIGIKEFIEAEQRVLSLQEDVFDLIQSYTRDMEVQQAVYLHVMDHYTGGVNDIESLRRYVSSIVASEKLKQGVMKEVLVEDSVLDYIGEEEVLGEIEDSIVVDSEIISFYFKYIKEVEDWVLKRGLDVNFKTDLWTMYDTFGVVLGAELKKLREKYGRLGESLKLERVPQANLILTFQSREDSEEVEGEVYSYAEYVEVEWERVNKLLGQGGLRVQGGLVGGYYLPSGEYMVGDLDRRKWEIEIGDMVERYVVGVNKDRGLRIGYVDDRNYEIECIIDWQLNDPCGLFS